MLYPRAAEAAPQRQGLHLRASVILSEAKNLDQL